LIGNVLFFVVALKNLGTVRALQVATSPPSNTEMLWYNTGVNSYTQYRHHFYDTNLSDWIEVAADSPVSLSPTTLTDNAVTYINIGSKSSDTLIRCEFLLVRNGEYATGYVEVFNDGSTVQILEPTGRVLYGDSDEVGSSAVAFTVQYSGDTIRLVCTLSNTGSNATITIFSLKQIS
jgi:hypothetical protein